MIVRRTWERLARDPKGYGNTFGGRRNYLDTYTGWFLFGVLPLYIRRDRARR